MIDTLVHTFTIKLADTKNLARTIWLYNQTCEKAKEFYRVKLFTDVESANLLEQYYDEVELINTDDIYLLDDMKLSALPNLKLNELLIDGDIYIREKLFYENNFDILCEAGYDRHFSPQSTRTINLYLEMGIQNQIPFYDDSLSIVPNVGILYFKSKKLQDEYLHWYRIFRKWVIDNKLQELHYSSRRQINKPSAQYLLGIFAEKLGKVIGYTSGLSDYTHYQLDIKYKENFKIER